MVGKISRGLEVQSSKDDFDWVGGSCRFPRGDMQPQSQRGSDVGEIGG